MCRGHDLSQRPGSLSVCLSGRNTHAGVATGNNICVCCLGSTRCRYHGDDFKKPFFFLLILQSHKLNDLCVAEGRKIQETQEIFFLQCFTKFNVLCTNFKITVNMKNGELTHCRTFINPRGCLIMVNCPWATSWGDKTHKIYYNIFLRGITKMLI